MTEPKFKPFDLKLFIPKFSSLITYLIIDLDYLRNKNLSGTTNANVFFLLKQIFHTLESIGLAGIEGNNTTIVEYIETKLDGIENPLDRIKEIQNIEKAILFIEQNIKDYPINRIFINELHKRRVDGLPPPPNGEGDLTPKDYRPQDRKINKSNYLPPDNFLVNTLIQELFDFTEKDDSRKYDLLKIVIAHLRLVWIHPFGSGNGRTVRLFTYAMLVKNGFKVNEGRIINPSAVFCADRDGYCKFLSHADEGSDEGILSWCEYVLKGIREKVLKIDKLLDYNFLKKEILIPTINYSQ